MWLEKFNKDKKEKIKKLTFNFADIKKGQKMLVSSPKSISKYIKKIPQEKNDSKGKRKNFSHIRKG